MLLVSILGEGRSSKLREFFQILVTLHTEIEMLHPYSPVGSKSRVQFKWMQKKGACLTF